MPAEPAFTEGEFKPGLGRIGGLGAILIATAVAGASTYVLQAIVLAAFSPPNYLQFSIMWSALYLVIGALAGVQQEVTRATTSKNTRSTSTHRHVTAVFSGIAALTVFAAVMLSGLWWGPAIFPSDPVVVVTAVAVGAASYVAVACLSGTLYGLNRWFVLAVMIATDALVRLVLVACSVALVPTLFGMAAAVVIPFPLTLGVVWLIIRRSVRGRTQVDVPITRLAWNASRTVVGSAATAVMVSGFAFLLGATSRADSAREVALVVAIVTLTRAPLVIPLLAVQSFLLVHFRDNRDRVGVVLAKILGLVAVGTSAASLLALWLGAPILRWFDHEYVADPTVIALVVASAGLTAAMCATGPAVLARGGHAAYSLGWVVAAILVILGLLLPWGPDAKSIFALSLGPIVGLTIHLVYVLTHRYASVRVRS